MSKVLAFLNNRPGAAAAAEMDPNVPRVYARGSLGRQRTLYAHFPKALTPGFIVLGLKDIQRHAVELVEHQESRRAEQVTAPADALSAPEAVPVADTAAAPTVSYKMILRSIERRGDEAVIAKFAGLEDATEALNALERVASHRTKKRWIVAGLAAVIFVVFFMPIPSGNGAQQQPQRVSARTDYSSSPTQMLAMPPRTGGIANGGIQPMIQSPSISPQQLSMPQGAFPSPMAPSTGAMPKPGVDTSTMPLPSPAVLPNQAAQQQVQPQVQIPAGQQVQVPNQQPRPSDDDPFGLKLVPGAAPNKR